MATAGKITVTKFDAARRQFDTAIEIWFADGDPVAVHTLVSAAHEIIHTLFRRKGLRGLLFDSAIIKEEYRSELAMRIKAYATFFKHAQRDPDAEIEFDPTLNETLFVICLMGLQGLGHDWNEIESAFFQWTVLHRPDWVSKAVPGDIIPPETMFALRRLSKQELLEHSRLGFALARAAQGGQT